MRAVVLHAVVMSSIFAWKNVPIRIRRRRSVVRLRAAALNHRDVWIRKGQYAGIKVPIILGSDGAGEVVEVGDGCRSSWLGREVVIRPVVQLGTGRPGAGQFISHSGIAR
jgi:NADPH:quinone reductase-like Zn-dependent oxidoreductase